MTEPQVRRAGAADAEALAAIGAATFTETFGRLYAPEDLRRFLAAAHSPAAAAADLADSGRAAWLVEAAGEVVGYALAGACALPHPDVTAACGELKRIYFLRAAQGHGLGGRLFDAATAWLRAAGYTRLWIGVWSENHGAQRFYARRGLEKVGEYGFPVGAATDLEFILSSRKGQLF